MERHLHKHIGCKCNEFLIVFFFRSKKIHVLFFFFEKKNVLFASVSFFFEKKKQPVNFFFTVASKIHTSANTTIYFFVSCRCLSFGLVLPHTVSLPHKLACWWLMTPFVGQKMCDPFRFVPRIHWPLAHLAEYFGPSFFVTWRVMKSTTAPNAICNFQTSFFFVFFFVLTKYQWKTFFFFKKKTRNMSSKILSSQKQIMFFFVVFLVDHKHCLDCKTTTHVNFKTKNKKVKWNNVHASFFV